MMRCGEHADFGTMTLLMQDELGGLEVKDTEDGWIKATPIPGAILVSSIDTLS